MHAGDAYTSGQSGAVDETRLTTWVAEHLSVSWWVAEDGDVLSALEEAVLSILDPPLNLSGRDVRTPARSSRMRLRKQLLR